VVGLLPFEYGFSDVDLGIVYITYPDGIEIELQEDRTQANAVKAKPPMIPDNIPMPNKKPMEPNIKNPPRKKIGVATIRTQFSVCWFLACNSV
jgi:hypothetical protein